MISRKGTPWVVAALLAAGAACIGLRLYARHALELTEGDSLWRLNYAIDFHSDRPGAKVHLALPSDTEHSRVFHQDMHYSGLSAERLRPSRSQTREVTLSTLQEGQYHLTARFDIHLSRQAHWRANPPDARLSADERARYLRSTPTIQIGAASVAEALRQLRADPTRPPDAARQLFEFCRSQIQRGGEDGPSDAATVLQQRTASPLGLVRAMVALCRASKLPARIVTGFAITESSAELRPQSWVEVLTNHHWESFDPENGYAGELPYDVVPVRRDGLEIVHVDGGQGIEPSFSLVRLPPGLGVTKSRHGRLLYIFDLTRLPLEMHDVLSLMLLLPLGALVTAIFRTIVGLRTFGTFTPSLIALSFVFSDWRTGICVFVVVIALGLVARSALDRLRLLMVPRLSVILTIVVLCIIFAVSLMDYLEWTPSAQAVLLPMVILTMTVERFYLTTEEDGASFALWLLGGTVFVAACCYLVLRWDQVGRLLLSFPEVHLVTIAVLVLIGRYTGYRISELWRFRDLVRPASDRATS